MGHTTKAMSVELGIAESMVSEIANQARGWEHLKPELWAKVDTLYRNWGDTNGNEASRRRAARKGWVTGAAWDDIDNPNEMPNTGKPTPRPQGGAGRPFADVVEDVEDILSWEPYTTATELAHRLGYRDSSGIQIALRRGERTDLLAQLARNAEVAA